MKDVRALVMAALMIQAEQELCLTLGTAHPSGFLLNNIQVVQSSASESLRSSPREGS
jgi:hypothetical protein